MKRDKTESDSKQGEEFYEIWSKIEANESKISRHEELHQNQLPLIPLFRDIWNIHPGVRINRKVHVKKMDSQIVYTFRISHVACDVKFDA